MSGPTNKTMSDIAEMARLCYEQAEPKVPWEQADSADVQAACRVVLATMRFTQQVKLTQTTREGLAKLREFQVKKGDT
jgi:hypothetical protein